jgi:hypothetical protein
MPGRVTSWRLKAERRTANDPSTLETQSGFGRGRFETLPRVNTILTWRFGASPARYPRPTPAGGASARRCSRTGSLEIIRLDALPGRERLGEQELEYAPRHPDHAANESRPEHGGGGGGGM